MIPGSVNPLLLGAEAAAGGYSISRSLRFNSSDSAYLSRTPSVASNRRTWTWAGWVKRSALGSGGVGVFFNAYSSGTNEFILQFGTDTLRIASYISAYQVNLETSSLFRDPSAWYHVVAVFDTTNATSTDRVRLYVNGTRITTFSTATYPSQNYDGVVNSTVLHTIGTDSASRYFSGLLADIHFCDGYAYDPSYFTTTDANGIIQPKAFTGSYGTNGFRLPFSNNASTTTISQDSSGNNNHWTANNISITAGAGNDSLVDSPTSGTASSGGDAGGVVVGNYAVLNPLAKGSPITLANGNLDYSQTATDAKVLGTIGMSSGKWYWEITPASGTNLVGIAQQNSSLSTSPGFDANSWCYYSTSGNKYTNSTSAAYGASFTTNDVIGVAFDADNGTLAFYKNGASQGTAYTGLTSGPYFPAVGNSSSSGTANFGQRSFAMSGGAPAGYKALCSTNLPTPTILKGSSYFDTKLYTGNGGLQTISGLGFSPDLVWCKMRSGVAAHSLYDIIRGTGKTLSSNATNAEATEASTASLTAFNSDGFALGTDNTGIGSVNLSGYTYAAFCWDAGTSTVTNTAGSITSSCRTSVSSGFSIVSYSNGTTGSTIGHGLGVKPSLIIVKRRSAAGQWTCYHSDLGATKWLALESTAAAATNVGAWNNTEPTSSVFTVGSYGDTNGSGGVTMIAYCFAPVSSYSAFGSYTGNGSADGPFVFCNFRPKLVMWKRTDTTGNWVIVDTSRNTYNFVGEYLLPNASDAAGSTEMIDIVSNGFKLRYTNATGNASGGTYIWASFAESPFSIARAR